MACQPVFEPDDEYDLACASDGVSRYGAYLARYVAWFADDGVPTTHAAKFAAAAWRVAQPPTMAPGYVRTNVVGHNSYACWDDDQGLIVCVDLAVPAERDAIDTTNSWRCWTRNEQGWPEPDDYTHLTEVRIAVPLVGVRLPDPCYWRGRPDTTTAKRAVHLVCVAVNAAARSAVAFDPPARSPW